MTPSSMMRAPRRHLLALAMMSATATPALAQQTTDPNAAFGMGPASDAAPAAERFTIADIRLDGLQRIGAGTLFTYLPIERGDSVDSTRIGEAIRALYRTGFFDDVRMDREGDILIVTVTERPAINTLTITGNKDIKTEDLTKGLKDIGLAEGDTFDRLSLDRVTQELTRQYNNRGKYNVRIQPTVTRLDRNRVDVTIAITEGKAAKIRHINIVGNDKFDEEEIREGWESRESNWLSWYRRDDQYSREKLEGDREKLQNFYLDRGYIDYSEDSMQVAIGPDKRDMFITAGITEGEQYTVSSIQVSGDTVLPKQEVEKRLLVKPGQIFSRRLLELSSDSITNTLGNIGYAFARVNPVPSVDKDKRTVAIDMQVVPGPRVSVRRIVFKGNTRTADEVMRREMRQFEGAWYSQAAIDRSKVRLQQLGYFESGSVDIATEPVQASSDEVDLVISVKETTSGSFVFGLGYSQLYKLQTSIQLSQNNFLGSGNRVSVQAMRNRWQDAYAFSFLNPYFTDAGVSLGYNLNWSKSDYSSADTNTVAYSSDNRNAQAVLGLPITEFDSITAAFGIGSNRINAIPGYSPEVIIDYIDALGQRTFHNWTAELGWARDTRNDYFAPTRGTYQRISAEVALPGSTVEYYKLNYEFSKYWPLHRTLVLNTRAELGYGKSYGSAANRDICGSYGSNGQFPVFIASTGACGPDASDYIKTVTADGLPFFENFYAGGVRSVRGFRDNTLGPRVGLYRRETVERNPGMPWNLATLEQPIGGSVKTVGSIEAIFPTLIDSPAARVSAFVDFGNVFADTGSVDAGELRASAGIALLWRAPVGPISISYAIPLRSKGSVYDASGRMVQQGDEIERLQFTFGGAF